MVHFTKCNNALCLSKIHFGLRYNNQCSISNDLAFTSSTKTSPFSRQAGSSTLRSFVVERSKMAVVQVQPSPMLHSTGFLYSIISYCRTVLLRHPTPSQTPTLLVILEVFFWLVCASTSADMNPTLDFPMSVINIHRCRTISSASKA